MNNSNHIRKSSTVGANTHIDNFSIRSRQTEKIMWEVQDQKIRRKERQEEPGRQKKFLINGQDFHAKQIVVQKQAEVLEDAYSVKGDYFYLKKGEIVNIRYAIGSFAEIKFENKIGYFLAQLFRLIEGERWKQAS